MIQIHTSQFFVLALLLLVLPFDWLSAALAAGMIHELCHAVILYALGGRIHRIKISPDGCVMETGELKEWRQFLSILAGPAGSFALLSLCHTMPKIAVCGLFQGLYNLIPVMPLDGGRLLRLLLYFFCPGSADAFMECISAGTCMVITISGIWLSQVSSVGSELLILILLWNIKLLTRKIPCKQS